VEEAVLYTDPLRGELDMVFQFEHVDLDSGPKGKWDVLPMTMLKLKQSLGRWQDGLAEVGWNSLYLGNHDQPRCVSRFGSDAPEHRVQSAKALATVLHLQRGTPYVYQGDELGMSNAGFNRLEQLRDVESLNYYATAVARGEDPADVIRALAYKSRDNARVPMSWDASPGAGFTTGTPWLDLHPLSSSVNATAQVDDPGSVFSHYRRLIALRHAEPCVAHGTFRMLLADHEQLYCFERSYGDTRLLVVANLSSAADVVPDLSELAAWSSAEPLIASIPGSSPTPTDPLAPWESRVFRLA
jgi:oligo-1,6-glucosidase